MSWYETVSYAVLLILSTGACAFYVLLCVKATRKSFREREYAVGAAAVLTGVIVVGVWVALLGLTRIAMQYALK